MIFGCLAQYFFCVRVSSLMIIIAADSIELDRAHTDTIRRGIVRHLGTLCQQTLLSNPHDNSPATSSAPVLANSFLMAFMRCALEEV